MCVARGYCCCFFGLAKPQKRERILFTIAREDLGGGGPPLPDRSKPATLSLISKGFRQKLTIFPLAFVPNFFDANSLQPFDFSVVGSTERILGLEGNLVFQSKSATDSPVPQHDKTENKRSARRLSVGKAVESSSAGGDGDGGRTGNYLAKVSGRGGHLSGRL